MKVLPAAPIVLVADGVGELSAELEVQPTVTTKEVNTTQVRIAKRIMFLGPFCLRQTGASELKICRSGTKLSAYRFEITRIV